MAGLRDLAQKLFSGTGEPEAARPADEKRDQEEGDVTRTELNVTGMTCGHCKAAVEGELGKLPGVSAEADVETGVVSVSYSPSQVRPEQLDAAVQEAGYSVTSS